MSSGGPSSGNCMPARRRFRSTARVRTYRPRDFGKVRQLWKRSGLDVGPSDRRAELERSRRRDPDLFLVAESAGELVGAVLGRFDGRRGWVNHLAVENGSRGQGIGRRLMAEIERRFRDKRCPKINLHVELANEPVCAFYEGLGYRRRKLIFMEKWLPRSPSTALGPDPRADARGSRTVAGRSSTRGRSPQARRRSRPSPRGGPRGPG